MEQVNINKRAGQAVVLTPTRELAMQVCQAVQSLKHSSQLRVLPVYGGQSIERQLSQLRRGVHMVVGTPGRVLDLLSRGALNFDQLSWMVLDEADEMLNMGFIQDVENILSHAPAERQTAFFSATMEPAIRELAAKFLKSPVTVKVKTQNTAPQRITQLAYVVPPGWSKPRALMPILEMEDPESAIIFVRTRRTAAELTRQLQFAGLSVEEYHGDLKQAQRERLLLRFKQGQVRWVVATDIAARGLHVDNLTHVINYELPDNLDSYVHRIGRTARAGKDGISISLVAEDELYYLREVEKITGIDVAVLDAPESCEDLILPTPDPDLRVRKPKGPTRRSGRPSSRRQQGAKQGSREAQPSKTKLRSRKRPGKNQRRRDRRAAGARTYGRRRPAVRRRSGASVPHPARAEKPVRADR